jgi:plastocyanin
VPSGTTVIWKNEDDSPHRIGDRTGTIKSAALDDGDTFSHTFATPGEYPYICTLHPYMRGRKASLAAANRHTAPVLSYGGHSPLRF